MSESSTQNEEDIKIVEVSTNYTDDESTEDNMVDVVGRAIDQIVDKSKDLEELTMENDLIHSQTIDMRRVGLNIDV